MLYDTTGIKISIFRLLVFIRLTEDQHLPNKMNTMETIIPIQAVSINIIRNIIINTVK